MRKILLFQYLMNFTVKLCRSERYFDLLFQLNTFMKKAYLDETCLFYLRLKNVNQMRMERIKGKEERKEEEDEGNCYIRDRHLKCERRILRDWSFNLRVHSYNPINRRRNPYLDYQVITNREPLSMWHVLLMYLCLESYLHRGACH